jgi:hypothetical protein
MEAFEKLADAGFARDVLLITTGYAAASAMDIGADTYAGRDVPGEALGIAVVVGAEYGPGVSGRQKRQVQLGGGAYSALSLADRLNIRGTIEEAI